MKFFMWITLIAFLTTSCNRKANGVREDFLAESSKLVVGYRDINSEYDFKVKGKEVDEYKLRYIGGIKMRNGDSLLFLTSIRYSGYTEDREHATCGIDIFNVKEEYIGSYGMGGGNNVPAKIYGENLIIAFNDSTCNQTTAISFYDSIPKQIFIKCRNGAGDIYNFGKE